MSLPKTLLLATAFATIITLPAFATEATTPAPTDMQSATGAPVPMDAPTPVPTTDPTMAAPMDQMNAAPGMADPAPTPSPTPAPTPAPVMEAPPVATPGEPVAPMAPASEDTMAAPEPTPAPTTMAPDEVTPPTEEAVPVTPEPAPAPEPEKKKVTKPAKLSALSKKYGLLDLDTNGDKALSKAEFTANGFANDKVFNRFDVDGNGKLTNGEMNAYASNIEANSKR